MEGFGMNTDRLLAAGIALCCIFAIGTSASTLGTSVHTKPDDVIDINYKSLPINPNDAGELKREAQSKGSPASSQSKKEQTNRQASQQQQKQSNTNTQKQQSKSKASWKQFDFLEDLLALLRKLMRVLVWVVPVAVLVGGVAVGVRFRDHLFDDSATETTSSNGPASPPAPTPDPSNEIERAWWSMVERFGVDRPHTKTPGECAREAIDAGGDEDAVRTLTRTFEEVRYGGEPITDDRLDRIRHGSDRLGGET
ncbi:hypothetical protein ZOD2009_15481 [Haladaptatus paucihalophilus DX253]|uniref:Protein-glutamine gamma-glutamyltransferase-like C-terminal domain-containing protein n=1 Tax=Haladaptatus paucihalophilus DX253 TaxID=797209 RepID=E7QWA8_HALPU|nr:hypothetical protein ZOD2009_15481 [Haladaptatus paucihalophilus DX253]